MPFILIKGKFKPLAGIPDGDSVRFMANNLSLWEKLEGRKVQIETSPKTKDTVQLRFEGIDAIEKSAIKSLSKAATDSMLKLIGFHKTENSEPEGYILSRMTDDKAGRPICFAFAGKADRSDGAKVHLEADELKKSVNYQQMLAGYAYPLYYNTLFACLREEFNEALRHARKNSGYWPTDGTNNGVIITDKADLKTIPPIWPKLWRRLEEYFKKNNSLAGFKDFLEQKNERLDILSLMEERGFQDVVEVQGNQVRLLEPPENLRIVGKAGRRTRY